jgi:hypothetical protein
MPDFVEALQKSKGNCFSFILKAKDKVKIFYLIGVLPE